MMHESLCPPGACVTCTSSALSALKFRIFVKNSEKLWYKAIKNLSNIDYDKSDSDSLKSICAFVTQNDLSLEMAKDYTGGEPQTVVNRTKIKAIKKTERKPRCPRTGPSSSCLDCNKSFSSPFFLYMHLRNSGTKEACLTCGAIASRGLEMKEHMQSVHKVNALLCNKCPSLFNTEEDLKKHAEKAHKPGAHTCTDCGRTFPRLSSFENHSQMHLVRMCRKCGAQFTNRSCYRAHRSECEPDAKPNTKMLSRSRRSNIRDPATYICDYCDKKYTSRPQIKNHILWIHMDVRPYQCKWCGKRFYTSTRLTEHSVVHTRVRNFECDICGVKLVSKMAAVYHRRRHTGEKPYTCEDCGAAFISSSRRLEHAKRKHNKGVRLQCPDCPLTFVRKSELKKHSDKAHTKKYDMEVVGI